MWNEDSVQRGARSAVLGARGVRGRGRVGCRWSLTFGWCFDVLNYRVVCIPPTAQTDQNARTLPNIYTLPPNEVLLNVELLSCTDSLVVCEISAPRRAKPTRPVRTLRTGSSKRCSLPPEPYAVLPLRPPSYGARPSCATLPPVSVGGTYSKWRSAQ